MTRAIDVLAKAMPNGHLMAALGPLAFLGSAAEHIEALATALATSQAEVSALKEANEKLHDAIGSMAREGVETEASLERARGLLERFRVGASQHAQEWYAVDVRAFLATPPNPIATPGTPTRENCPACAKVLRHPGEGYACGWHDCPPTEEET